MSNAFADRREAGCELARALAALRLVDPIVLALPRGGVPVAVEVAAALHAPLDLLLVRKIGAPDQRELAVAAVAEGSGDGLVLDTETMAMTGASNAYVEREARRELEEIVRRRKVYLGGRAPLPIEGKTAVVVDDLVCLSQPPSFYAVGAHYADFHQVSDDEVAAALEPLLRAAQGRAH